MCSVPCGQNDLVVLSQQILDFRTVVGGSRGSPSLCKRMLRVCDVEFQDVNASLGHECDACMGGWLVVSVVVVVMVVVVVEHPWLLRNYVYI